MYVTVPVLAVAGIGLGLGRVFDVGVVQKILPRAKQTLVK
jgi:hypothetical protein